jgi:enoyl-CoA hydratase
MSELPRSEGKLALEVDGAIATLTLDNTRRLNAMTLQMWSELEKHLDVLALNSDVRVLILQGRGGRAFCSGNDVTEYDSSRARPDDIANYNNIQRRGQAALELFPKPVVAAIDGYCLGAGFELALLCDLRYCATSARFGIPAAKLGLPYRFEDLMKVIRVIGAARARELVFFGEQIDARQASLFGLVSGVFADRASLDAEVRRLAAALAANAPLTLRAAKQCIAEAQRRDAAPNLQLCDELAAICYNSLDYVEGRRAFAEKRTPKFLGR